MIKLLKAGFFRLKKEAIFWLFVITSVVSAIFFINNRESPIIDSEFSKIINLYALFIGVLSAIFISVFVGKERSEGIIRNKIITRT